MALTVDEQLKKIEEKKRKLQKKKRDQDYKKDAEIGRALRAKVGYVDIEDFKIRLDVNEHDLMQFFKDEVNESNKNISDMMKESKPIEYNTEKQEDFSKSSDTVF